MIGKSFLNKPYMNHSIVPTVIRVYIPKDKSLVCFVLIVLMAWGKNAMVVHEAATRPRIVIKFM